MRHIGGVKGQAATIRLVGSEDEPSLGEPETPLSFDAIYQRFAPYVATIAYRLSGTYGDTEDIIQEVFFQVSRKWRLFRTWFDVKPWLATVTVRICRRQLNRQRRWRWALPLALESISCRAVSPEASAEVKQAVGLLSQLTVDQRIAWVLFHAEGEDIDTIALQCGCSRATVKRRLQEARILLSEWTHEIR